MNTKRKNVFLFGCSKSLEYFLIILKRLNIAYEQTIIRPTSNDLSYVVSLEINDNNSMIGIYIETPDLSDNIDFVSCLDGLRLKIEKLNAVKETEKPRYEGAKIIISSTPVNDNDNVWFKMWKEAFNEALPKFQLLEKPAEESKKNEEIINRLKNVNEELVNDPFSVINQIMKESKTSGKFDDNQHVEVPKPVEENDVIKTLCRCRYEIETSLLSTSKSKDSRIHNLKIINDNIEIATNILMSSSMPPYGGSIIDAYLMYFQNIIANSQTITSA